ncbi:MAG: transposase [Brasilonema angustatum HA4187-MV1]|jgi:REP element-mobilizing transposase RayT|nr:transposase [Brasilonema angustatum HA4187-MV1]
MTLFKNKYRVESIRLPNRDYAANGYYFVTICTNERQWFFGDVINGQMHLSTIGQIAEKFWVEIPKHCQDTYIDTYVIMPNHMHGIVVIERSECRTFGCNVSTNFNQSDISKAASEISPKAGTLSVILRSYKSAVTKWCRMNGYPEFAWQQRFYEHIIRADGSLDQIREYILYNSVKWEHDKNNPANLWM